MGNETIVQMREVKKGVEAMGSVVERYMIRWLGPLGRKISEATEAPRCVWSSARPPSTMARV